jgi:hypothetical protein
MEGPVKGEVMTYRGRPHVVVGMDPVGATPRLIYLEDTATNESQTVTADELNETLTRRLRLIRGGKLDPRD